MLASSSAATAASKTRIKTQKKTRKKDAKKRREKKDFLPTCSKQSADSGVLIKVKVWHRLATKMESHQGDHPC